MSSPWQPNYAADQWYHCQHHVFSILETVLSTAYARMSLMSCSFCAMGSCPSIFLRSSGVSWLRTSLLQVSSCWQLQLGRVRRAQLPTIRSNSRMPRFFDRKISCPRRAEMSCSRGAQVENTPNRTRSNSLFILLPIPSGNAIRTPGAAGAGGAGVGGAGAGGDQCGQSGRGTAGNRGAEGEACGADAAAGQAGGGDGGGGEGERGGGQRGGWPAQAVGGRGEREDPQRVGRRGGTDRRHVAEEAGKCCHNRTVVAGHRAAEDNKAEPYPARQHSQTDSHGLLAQPAAVRPTRAALPAVRREDEDHHAAVQVAEGALPLILPLQQCHMTSSPLQKQLNFFVYNTMAEDGLIPLIKGQIPLKQLEKSPLLLDQRWQTHLSEREQGRINAYRYAEGFRIAQTTSDPNKIYQSLDYTISTLGLTLNTNAFLVSTDLLGDEQQTKHWREQVYSGKVIGAYGQTELGHGSNVKDLETVAVYHEDKQKWIINSPSETSAKYWPGILGHFATHSVIQAKAIVKGKSIGVQTFVVELRNERLEPLKNVECFDIGPKLGFEKVDNGACLFKNVELPREAMLMRYVKVLPDGTVQGLENTQAIKYGYGSMLNLRVKLTYSFALGSIIHPACNLYQVLNKLGQADSPTSRKKLTDFACVGYGIVISNRNTHNIFNSLMTEIKNKNFAKADKLLISCHIISSTHKAVSSRIGMDINGQLLTYNSQGKFKSSFLPFSYVSMTPSTTYEGDNTVLLQQTSKYLLFKFDTEKDLSAVPRKIKSSDWENASKAMEYIIAEKLKGIKARIEQYGEKGVAFKTVWNEKEQVSLVQVSSLWGYMMFLRGIAVMLPTITENQSFYTKICASFTSYLVERVTQLQVYGFTIERVPTWQAFTLEEYQALLNINAPVERTIEPMRFYPREGDWLSAKL